MPPEFLLSKSSYTIGPAWVFVPKPEPLIVTLWPCEKVPDTPSIAGVPTFVSPPPPPPQEAVAIDAITDRKKQLLRLATRDLLKVFTFA
jgi:hypothetical protein